jgi:F-type H+-transporting ATPase subunit c
MFSLLAQVSGWTFLSDRSGVALGAGLGAGLIVIGAAKGIGHLAGQAMEGIARQPEAGGRIGTNMIIAAALIEGFTFFALVIAFQLAGKLAGNY